MTTNIKKKDKLQEVLQKELKELIKLAEQAENIEINEKTLCKGSQLFFHGMSESFRNISYLIEEYKNTDTESKLIEMTKLLAGLNNSIKKAAFISDIEVPTNNQISTFSTTIKTFASTIAKIDDKGIGGLLKLGFFIALQKIVDNDVVAKILPLNVVNEQGDYIRDKIITIKSNRALHEVHDKVLQIANTAATKLAEVSDKKVEQGQVAKP